MEVKKEVKIPKKKKIGYKDWWDRSCTKKKRLTHRMCIKWRKNKIRRGIHRRKKRTERIPENKKREKKEEEMELKSLYNTADVWRCINKKRGRKSGNPGVIKMEEWEEYFIGLLDGKRVDKNNTKEDTLEVYRSDSTVIEEGREKEEEKKIEKEIYKAIEKMERRGRKRRKLMEYLWRPGYMEVKQ